MREAAGMEDTRRVTARGERTRARLVEAARELVVEGGYAQATTRAIAQRAGVSEATIYRHFPDKRALFVTALIEDDVQIGAWLEDLPDRAGTGEIAENLGQSLVRLAGLRASMAPIERALREDPDPSDAVGPAGAVDLEQVGGPPAQLVAYLGAEQDLGRVRADVDPEQVVLLLLAMLGGLAAAPPPVVARIDDLILEGVRHLVHGIATPA